LLLPLLAPIQRKNTWTSRARIHVLNTAQSSCGPCVYLGKLGLLGEMPDEEEDSGAPPAKRKRGDEDDSNLPVKKQFLDPDEKLKELNEKEVRKGSGREWVLGPSIQLPSSEEEETCPWDIPEGYSFFTHRLVGNNKDDAKIAIRHHRDNYSRVDKKSSKKYTENKGALAAEGLGKAIQPGAKYDQSTTTGQEKNEEASRNNASLEIAVTRKVKVSSGLFGRKKDSDSGLLEVHVLLCIEKKR